MHYHTEIVLHRVPDDDQPEIFVFADEDDDRALAYLPQASDFIVIDRVHMGIVSNRTFAFERDNRLCHIIINAERVTGPPPAAVSH
jgi:hypothetical protein